MARPRKIVKGETPNTNPKSKTQRFFGIRSFGVVPGEHYESFQIEVLEMEGDEIKNRYWYGKRNVKPYIMAEIELITSPGYDEELYCA